MLSSWSGQVEEHHRRVRGQIRGELGCLGRLACLCRKWREVTAVGQWEPVSCGEARFVHSSVQDTCRQWDCVPALPSDTGTPLVRRVLLHSCRLLCLHRWWLAKQVPTASSQLAARTDRNERSRCSEGISLFPLWTCPWYRTLSRVVPSCSGLKSRKSRTVLDIRRPAAEVGSVLIALGFCSSLARILRGRRDLRGAP